MSLNPTNWNAVQNLANTMARRHMATEGSMLHPMSTRRKIPGNVFNRDAMLALERQRKQKAYQQRLAAASQKPQYNPAADALASYGRGAKNALAAIGEYGTQVGQLFAGREADIEDQHRKEVAKLGQQQAQSGLNTTIPIGDTLSAQREKQKALHGVTRALAEKHRDIVGMKLPVYSELAQRTGGVFERQMPTAGKAIGPQYAQENKWRMFKARMEMQEIARNRRRELLDRLHPQPRNPYGGIV